MHVPPERMFSVEHLVQLSTVPAPCGRSLLWQVLLHGHYETVSLLIVLVCCSLCGAMLSKC
jgi:hypothetical protein